MSQTIRMDFSSLNYFLWRRKRRCVQREHLPKYCDLVSWEFATTLAIPTRTRVEVSTMNDKRGCCFQMITYSTNVSANTSPSSPRKANTFQRTGITSNMLAYTLTSWCLKMILFQTRIEIRDLKSYVDLLRRMMGLCSSTIRRQSQG